MRNGGVVSTGVVTLSVFEVLTSGLRAFEQLRGEVFRSSQCSWIGSVSMVCPGMGWVIFRCSGFAILARFGCDDTCF